MSNPQVGHLDELIYLRPEVKTVRDPETHDDLDLTWMPMNWSATVADPTAHNGQRRLSDGTVVADPTAKDGTRQIVSRRHLQVVMPSRAEERQYVEDRPCLKCKHFDYTNGQKEIQHQLLRIPRVRAFLTGYLAMQTEHGNSIGLEEHGLCKLGAESGGEKVTSPMETCSSWKARRGGWLHTLLGGKK